MTNGGEYQLANGQEYIGPYHIHPNKGPMVGSKHVNAAHESLFPIQSDISLINRPGYGGSSTPASSGGGGGGGGGY